MLSLSYIGGTGQDASDYYNVVTRQIDATEKSNPDYYTKKPGEYYGRLARELGYRGPVTEKSFINLVEGKGKTGKILVKPGVNGKRRGGYDLSFSAPKSLSIIAELTNAPELKQQLYNAHEAAVNTALSYLEHNYAQARTTIDGQTRVVDTGNLLIAKFTEATSRALDPQLHTHNVVFNITKRPDGQLRALTNESLHDQKMFTGQIYRNELAKHLTNLGFNIDRQAKGLFEIQGLSKEFSTRSEEIEKALPALREKYPKMNEAKLRECAALETRGYKKNISPSELRKDWQNRLAQHGIKPEKLLKNIYKQPPLKFKATNHIELALELATSEESVVTKERLLDVAMKLSMGQKTIDNLETELFQSKNLRTVVPGKLFTSQEIQLIERKLATQVKGSHNQSKAISSYRTLLETMRQKLFAGLGKDQAKALQFLLANKDRIVGVQGDSGTGKTYMLKLVAKQFAKQGYDIVPLAPTTIAVEELRKEELPNSQTIQKFLVTPEKEKPKRPRLFIIDESSMLGSKQLDKILQRTTKRDRVILAGDAKQLQSIEAGAVFTKLQNHKILNTVRLRENMRQKNQLAKDIATNLAEKNITQAFEQLLKNNKIKEIEGKYERLQAVANEYLEHHKKKETLVVVETNAERQHLNKVIRDELIERGEINKNGRKYDTHQPKNLRLTERNLSVNYNKKDRIFLTADIGKVAVGSHGVITRVNQTNDTIECVLKDRKKIQPIVINVKTHGHLLSIAEQQTRTFAKGDKVIFLKADRGLNVQNGTTAQVVNIDPFTKNIRVKTDQKRTLTVNLKNYPYLDYAHALTNYKVQGKTADHVLFVSDTRQASNFNSLYVAATRGRHDLSIYTNDQEQLKEQVQIEQNKTSNLDYEIPIASLNQDLSPTLEIQPQFKSDEFQPAA